PIASPVDYDPEWNNVTLTSGAHYVGKTLEASLDVVDANGTTGATLTYNWYRYDGISYTLTQTSTSKTYQVQEADLGYEIKFSVSFTDDDGFVEQSDFYGFVGRTVESMPDLDPSWTNPTLTSGDHYVTKELTAGLDFTDPNGTTASTATFIWYRVDQNGSTEIQRSTNNTYTITEDDVGYEIRFAVEFTDDDGNV
ncbi:MAG: hypothetical protein VW907_09615, partial [Opitutae bacterium]